MRHLLRNAAFLVVTLVTTPALAESTRDYANRISDARALIALQDFANDKCRDSPNAEQACEDRDVIQQRLKRLGWCLGKQGQIAADYRWHRCGRNSLRSAE